MNSIKALLFDLDGTLVNTHMANYEAYRLALAEQGVNITWDKFKKTIGMQSTKFLPILAPNLTEASCEQVRKSKKTHYEELLHMTAPNFALIEFLKSMSIHYKTALVTTAQKASAMNILRRYDLDSYFNHIITAADVKKHKPNPEGYLLALNALDVLANEAIAFEDSEIGMQAAMSAGISVITIRDFTV